MGPSLKTPLKQVLLRKMNSAVFSLEYDDFKGKIHAFLAAEIKLKYPTSSNHSIQVNIENKEHIKKAIQLVNPYAIDLSSGVESKPGIKDYEKMNELMKLVH